MRPPVRLLPLALSLCLLAGACGGDGPPEVDDTAESPLAGGDSADPIIVGAVLLDLEAAAPLGLGLDNYDLDTQRSVFQAFARDINDSGGIDGRPIELVFGVNDPLRSAEARATCLELTQDQDAFAVLGFVTDAYECIAQEQQTPLLVHTAGPAQTYADTGNFLISPLPSFERNAEAWAAVADSTGILDGATVGVVAVADGAEEELQADALVSALEAMGHPVGYRFSVPQTPGTDMSGPIAEMRSAGVDTVFLATNFATALQFVGAAETQQFMPQYVTSDLGNLASDGLVRRMPTSFDGALGVAAGRAGIIEARSGEAAPQQEQECLDRYNSADLGPELSWGEEHPVFVACWLMDVFAIAARAADELTAEAFVEAVEGLGQVSLGGRYGGSFAPGKTDYGDVFRLIRWSADCVCYEVAGEPVTVE